MRPLLACALLTMTAAEAVRAHRLDEYLQATLLGVTRSGIEVEIRLTPGVAVLPVVLAAIDQDHDGLVSQAEQQAYARLVAHDVELQVDGVRSALMLTESTFPKMADMQAGLGTIVVKLRTDRTGRELRFENRHLPRISVYLVNCLADPAEKLQVGPQQRDEAQRSLRFEYSFGVGTTPARMPRWVFWPAAIGMLLIGRTAILIYQQRTANSGMGPL